MKYYDSKQPSAIVSSRKAVPQNGEDVLTVKAYAEFINLFLETTKSTAGTAATDTLIEYFEYNPILFEGCRLSEEQTIEIEPILHNLNRIPGKNRIPVICTLFSMVNYKLINLYSTLVPPQWTQTTLEHCYSIIKEKFGNTPAVSNILRAMPKGVLEHEKLALLSKEELEIRVKERTLELEESKEQLRMLKDFHEGIVEKAPVGIIRTNKDGKVVFINRKAEEIIGVPNGENITTKGWKMTDIFSLRSTLEMTELQTGRLEDMEHLAYNVPSEELYTNLVLNSIYGKSTQTSVCVVSMTDKDGKFDGALFLIEDITERKLLEEERKTIERLGSIGILAGGIAHDFNNLLTGIMGNIGLAMRHIEPKGRAMDRLAEAEKASLRARDLTQQLLTFARGGAPIKKTVAMGILIKDSASFALRGSNVKCEFSLPDDLWLVEADEGQMKQVIANLVINANEAMPEGGIINIGAKNTSIERKGILSLPKGNYVEITIEDHGVGISKEHLDKIFDPYFTTKQKGSGLGLSTTYSIIKNHNGHIQVKSTQNVGTTFRIYLSASRKGVPKEEESVVSSPIPGKGKILVMDDEDIIRQLLDSALTEAGYEVELTADGAEAIEHYAKARESGKPFDAVIMDLTISGGMGGKEAISRLLEIDPAAKVIVSSGYATDPIMSDFKKYGFRAVATKPYIVEELERKLRSILKGKK